MNASTVTEWIQALSALASAFAAFAILKISNRSAKASEDMLTALREERADRIRAARAPFLNATSDAEKLIGEIDAMPSSIPVRDAYSLYERLRAATNNV